MMCRNLIELKNYSEKSGFGIDKLNFLLEKMEVIFGKDLDKVKVK